MQVVVVLLEGVLLLAMVSDQLHASISEVSSPAICNLGCTGWQLP